MIKKLTAPFNVSKAYIVCLTIISLMLFAGCAKDQLLVDKTKEFKQLVAHSSNPFEGGWSLTLQPNGVSDIVPGGDISYRSTYKINGSKMKVMSSQNETSYSFTIISEVEIREERSKVILKLIE